MSIQVLLNQGLSSEELEAVRRPRDLEEVLHRGFPAPNPAGRWKDWPTMHAPEPEHRCLLLAGSPPPRLLSRGIRPGRFGK